MRAEVHKLIIVSEENRTRRVRDPPGETNDMDQVDLKEYIGFGVAPREFQLEKLFEFVEMQNERIDAMEVRFAQELATERKRVAELEKQNEDQARDAALMKQRLTKLESPAPVISSGTSKDHITTLLAEMKRLNLRQVRMKDIMRLLGLSLSQAKRLKPAIVQDSRFVLVQDPQHKQRHLFRLI